MKPLYYFIFPVLIFSSCISGVKDDSTQNVDLMITNVQLFDGETVKSNVYIAIKGGNIVAIDSTLKFQAIDTIDGNGKTIIPGLINAHAHVSSSDELKETIQAGVFVILDMHKSDERIADTLRLYQDSIQYATFYSAGFGATVPKGHPTQYSPNMEVIDQNTSSEKFVLNRIANNSDYLKIFREPQAHPRRPEILPPSLNFLQIDTLIKTAKENNLLSIAHISKVEDAVLIASLGIDGFAHIWEDESITDQQLDSLLDNNIFMIPTLYLLKTGLSFSPIKHSDSQVRGTHLTFDEISEDLVKLYNRGISILAGTDSPNFGFNHGTDLYKELVLLHEAGINNLDVLKTVTSNSALAFKLENAGFLRVSDQANFILINGNPLENIKDLSKIEGIWKKGVRIK